MSRLEKHRRNGVGLILVFLVIPSLLFAQYERPGSATAQFLKLDVSPRAAGMAGSYIAVASGAEATHYNPAALGWLQGTSLAASHTDLFANINLDFVAAARSFGRIGAFGISLTNLSTDQMEVRTPLQPEGTGETFYVSNLRAGLTYARQLTDHVTFGGTVNYIQMSLYRSMVEPAYSSDIAVLYTTDFRGFQFGMKIANFGSSITFVNEQYPLPLNFSFGLAMNAVERPNQVLKTTLSARKPNDGQTLLRSGIEWAFYRMFFLRAGYALNHDIATYAYGGGLQMMVGEYRVQFDYAYSDFDALGAVHRFGISLDIGGKTNP